jgi:pseudouridine-5'-phosphate glycosidase
MNHPDLRISPPVREALEQGRPVLALESTIISHGMPWPQNFETAHRVERVVKEEGVVPATIAIMDGELRVGLDEVLLEQLARAGPRAVKCSRRDIAFALEERVTAATTVAATMIIADLAGIRVFATGGIGGVHRNAADTLDISADLKELAQTPVAVVCAGPKAILDIALTREYLETHGVPVVGYRTDDLPAFYSRQSGFPVDYRVESCEQIARTLARLAGLGLKGGMVIANPVPEKFSLPRDRVEAAVQQALGEAATLGLTGKGVTPFLLERVAALTGGDSLAANIELVCENARLGARIARALCSLGH